MKRFIERLNMYERISLLLKNRYLPRWVIFLFDNFVVFSSFIISYELRYSIASMDLNSGLVIRQFLIAFSAYLAGFLVFKPFAGIIRHTTSHDIQRIFRAVLSSTIILVALTLVSRMLFQSEMLNVPLSVILIMMMVTFTLLTFSRIIIKYVYNYITRIKQESIPVMIYGAGDLGQATRLALERAMDPSYKIVGFIDANPKMHGLSRSGVIIYSPSESMNKTIPANSIKEVIIAISPGKMRKEAGEELFAYCLENKILLKKVPAIHEWLNGGFEARQIKKISIDDLLSREEIKLDTTRVQEGLTGKTILVTGAAGSIGSEIVRQLVGFRPGKIILLDQAESALYDLQMELRYKSNGSRDFIIVIADISDPGRMEALFRQYKPQIVFNAAAYKHVPLLEDNIYEAVKVNIGGTRLLADLSVKHKVEKFVMISTDKAVNPTSIMGATKRVCELYVQALTSGNGVSTKFITTRFGNVLGSNGSVVPLFTRQIEEGGPVTLTHKEIRRYFMTIPEACQLVLEAGFMGRGGEIFVFDMGEPVKIYDLAVKMISLAGLEPEKDIRIIETGLRPGEKLFEEMLADREHNLPTHNPKILIANMTPVDPESVKRNVTEILESALTESDITIVAQLRRLIPEFTPQNVKFS